MLAEVVHPASILDSAPVDGAGTIDIAGTIDSAHFDSAESVKAQAEELYRHLGARPWHLIPEVTRTHYRGRAAHASTAKPNPRSPRPPDI